MLVNKARLIELLDHQNPIVRDSSVRALERFFKDSTGVIKPIIEAISKYKDNSPALVAAIKYFRPNDEEIAELVKLFNETDGNKDEASMGCQYHIQDSLQYFPIELLRNNEKTIRFNKALSRALDRVFDMEKVKAQDPDCLWDIMKDICNRHNNEEMDREASQHVWLLSQGLLRHREQVKHKIIMHLSQKTDVDYHLENILVKMAGDLRIEETVPYLFEILEEADYMHIVYGACLKSLGQIGNQQVIDIINNDWDNKKQRSKNVEILEYIPEKSVEKLLIKALESETDQERRTLISAALCDIFSQEGAEKVLDIVERQDYDPQIAHLLDDVVPVFAYHNRKIDNIDEIQKRQDEYIEVNWKNNPLFESSRELRKAYNKIEKERQKEKARKKKNQRKQRKKNVVKMKQKKKKK